MSTTVQFLERSLQNNFEPTKEMVISTLHDLKSEIARLQALLAEFHVISQPQQMCSQPVELAELLRNVMPLAVPEFTPAHSRSSRSSTRNCRRFAAIATNSRQVL